MNGNDWPEGTGDEEVQFGGESPHRWRRWLTGGVLLVAAVAVAVLVVRDQTGPAGESTSPELTHPPPSALSPASGTTTAAATTTTSPVATTAPTSSKTHAPGAPKVSSVDLSWLHASSNWELFAYSRVDGVVVRIQPSQAKVTRTPVPPMQSGGPVHFVVREGAVFVHPIDYVPGYVVLDGEPARHSQGRIPDGGILLPGPEPNQLWVQRGRAGSRTYHLVTVQGRSTGVPVVAEDGFARSDGGGYLLMRGTGGVYQLGRGEPRRVTTGKADRA